MNSKTIVLATDFSKTPGGRYISDGPASGEDFRDRLLLPALRDNDQVIVDFDGVAGYAASFLEESFGGAVISLGLKVVQKKLKIKVSDDPNLEQVISNYMVKAAEAGK